MKGRRRGIERRERDKGIEKRHRRRDEKRDAQRAER
jgi:hypothetical protein